MTKRSKGRTGKPAKSTGVSNLLRSPIMRFLGVFLLIMIAFYLVWWTDFFRNNVLYPWNGLNAVISSALLNIFGFGTSTAGMVITSSSVSISIKEGCDAIEPAMLFSAAIVAFPAAVSKKIKGIAIGISMLFLINLFRIITLFLIQKYWPAGFDFMHIQFWQVAFILLAVIFWIAWMRTTSISTDAATTQK